MYHTAKEIQREVRKIRQQIRRDFAGKTVTFCAESPWQMFSDTNKATLIVCFTADGEKDSRYKTIR